MDRKTLTYEDIGIGGLINQKIGSDVITIPVGKDGDQIVELPFGFDKEKRISNNGYTVLGASGSGKSEFLKNIVINGCMKYSPKELNFWLLDPKYGIEFEDFKDLPHVTNEVLSYQTDTLDTLSTVCKEIKYRYGLFLEKGFAVQGASFNNIIEYNEVMDAFDGGKSHLSRLIVILDEFSDLNDACEDKKRAKKLEEILFTISERGASLGVYMVFSGSYLSKKATVIEENYVEKVDGKIVFRNFPDALNSKSIRKGFQKFSEDILKLSLGEAYFTFNGNEVQKMQGAFCQRRQMEKYKNEIVEIYGDE